MIYKIAKKYAGIAEFEDLAQEGYIGLCQAVDGYDPGQGIPFVSYAWKTIQRHLVRYILGEKNLPEYLQILIGQYKGLTSAFRVRYGRKPTRPEYGYYLGITREQQEQVKAVLWAAVDSLPEKQPAVIRKRYQENLTLQQTAIGC